MNRISSTVKAIDRWQQRSNGIGFGYAVIKKYSDDNGAYLAALLTYYGFLSLFPLLLVLVTLLHVFFNNDVRVQHEFFQSVNTYFPLLGRDLQSSIQSSSKTGVSLIIGTLITMYGARGAADVLRYVLDTAWQVPRSQRAGFPKNILRSLGIMGIAALAFLATVGASVFTSQLGHAVWVKILLNILGFAIVGAATTWTWRIALSRKHAWRELVVGGIVAGAVVQPLLTFGGLLVSRELKHLDSLYGTFALVLGLLFWLYLLAQVIVYTAELSAVRSRKLWPRAIDNSQATAIDKRLGPTQ